MTVCFHCAPRHLSGRCVGETRTREKRGPSERKHWRSGPPPHPPSFTGDIERNPTGFNHFARQVVIWQFQVRNWMPLSEAALRLYATVSGDAAEELADLPVSQIACDEGINNIMDRLCCAYHEPLLHRKAREIEELETMTRKADENLVSYVHRWNRTLRRFANLQIHPYDPQVEAHKFLSSARICASVRASIMTACKYEYNMLEIASAIRHIFPQRKFEHGSSSASTASPKRPALRPRNGSGPSHSTSKAVLSTEDAGGKARGLPPVPEEPAAVIEGEDPVVFEARVAAENATKSAIAAQEAFAILTAQKLAGKTPDRGSPAPGPGTWASKQQDVKPTPPVRPCKSQGHLPQIWSLGH